MNTRLQLLLLSSSRTAQGGFLEHLRDAVRDFFEGGARQAVFVPYAAVRYSHDEYTARVRAWFGQLGCTLGSLHESADPARTLADADAIVVGGGNTFQLLRELYRLDLIRPLRERAAAGIRYLGWSAGSNLVCPSICTTNDMPVTWPPSCLALGLVPFQINPHYTDAHPPGHQGETRDERLEEFTLLNPDVPVVALREGSALRVGDGQVRLLGEHSARILLGTRISEVAPDSLLTGIGT
ncbi:MAG TPA: dipeptidase PepE [Gammaproteobacteria bacterium]|nr:dipeptidase PepE [Gammaproteobacteria bacterium]